MFTAVERDQLRTFGSVTELPDDRPCVGYLTLDEFEASCERLGFPAFCLEECRSGQNRFHTRLEVYDTFSYGILPLLDIQKIRNPRRKIALFFAKNRFVLVNIDDTENRSRQIWQQILEHLGAKLTIERVVSQLLLHLIQGSNDILEECEQHILEMERSLLDNRIDPTVNRTIFGLKNGLTVRKEYYGELIDMGEALMDDENDLFSHETFRHLKVFTNRAQRLSDNAALLMENLVHVREAYQSAMDYRLNNTMKIFTVVTTIFLPLSLIVGWYGMNFALPEFTWRYGYVLAVGLCVAVVVFCLWFFRKKKLF